MQYIKSKNLPKIDQTIIPEPSPPPAPTGPFSPAEPTAVAPSFVAPPLPVLDGEEYIDIPNTNMRSTIAKRLTEAKVSTLTH